jgi:hypothetical protein
MSNRKCTSHNKNDKTPVWLEVPKDVKKSDLNASYTTSEHIPVIANQCKWGKNIVKTYETSLLSKCMLDQSHKTKINVSLQVNMTFSKLKKKERKKKKEYCLSNVKKSKMIIISGSHARCYAANISSHFGKDVDVMEMVMPCARLEDIIKMNIKEISW